MLGKSPAWCTETELLEFVGSYSGHGVLVNLAWAKPHPHCQHRSPCRTWVQWSSQCNACTLTLCEELWLWPNQFKAWKSGREKDFCGPSCVQFGGWKYHGCAFLYQGPPTGLSIQVDGAHGMRKLPAPVHCVPAYHVWGEAWLCMLPHDFRVEGM